MSVGRRRAPSDEGLADGSRASASRRGGTTGRLGLILEQGIENAVGGWLAGLLLAIVDLCLVPRRLPIRIEPRQFLEPAVVALALYPLAGFALGFLIGAFTGSSEGKRQIRPAGQISLILALWGLAAGATASFVVRLRTPGTHAWLFAALSVFLWGAVLLSMRRTLPLTIPRFVWRSLGGLWAGSLLAAFAFSRFGAARTTSDERPGKLVILITADTLRADALGAYGNPSARTPHLDALAASGALFLRAQAASSWTLPSHASMMTGLDFPQHGAGWRTLALRKGSSLIAETFHAQGFRTEAIASSTFTGSVFFGRGFDVFRDYIGSPAKWLAPPHFVTMLSRQDAGGEPSKPQRAPVVVDYALSCLDRPGSQFLWLHFFDPHTDYDPPSPFRPMPRASTPPPFDGRGEALLKVNDGRLPPPTLSETTRLRALYDGEVAFLDDQIGRLLGEIERRGLAPRTSLVFVADHGEAFGEHGKFLHTTLFQEVLHVPFIVWAPGRIPPGVKTDAVVRGIDVAPTLADLAGISWNASGDASSALPLLRDPGARPRPARSDRDEFVVPGRPRVRESSLLSWPWKLIVRADDEPVHLFNLDRDPEEKTDVSREEPRLVWQLMDILRRGDLKDDDLPGRSLDRDAVRQLRALGYLR